MMKVTFESRKTDKIDVKFWLQASTGTLTKTIVIAIG